MAADMEELRRFHNVCREGRMYTELLNEMNCEAGYLKQTRELVKNIFMYVLYNHIVCEYTAAFHRLYPCVNSWMYKIKKSIFPVIIKETIVKGKRKGIKVLPDKGRSIFANFITSCESIIWIDNILHDCVQAKIDVITKHDSVITSRDPTNIINSAYTKCLGLIPTIKKEQLTGVPIGVTNNLLAE